MNTALQRQNRRIAKGVPFAINTLELKAKKIQTFSRLSTDGGLTQAKALIDIIARAQPLQGIERRKRIKIDQETKISKLSLCQSDPHLGPAARVNFAA